MKMIQIKVSKVGTSFTGGLYPPTSVDNALAYFKANGYKIVSVS